MDHTAMQAIEAILEGGPVDLPVEQRRRRTDGGTDKIKVLYCGGYEHYERVGPSETDPAAVVYRWTARTRVAE
jgi:hypothetical protein